MGSGTGVNETPLGSGGGAAEAAGMGNDPLEIGDLSPDQISELQAKAAKSDENWEKFVRVSADLDNYKKRAIRERQEAAKYANESLIEKLLPIVDNFEAALAAANAPKQSGNVDALKTGVNMIYSQLKNFLSEAGVEEIDALNKAFDPNLHEAVSQQASETAAEGTVLQQMRKGYKLKERLIRPAMVVVAKKP